MSPDGADGPADAMEAQEDVDPAADAAAADSTADTATNDARLVFVVDIREPKRFRMLSLAHPEVERWKEHTLHSADIIVNGILFERKTPADFVAAMTEDRLDAQVDKMADNGHDAAYILLEGSFADFEDLDHSRMAPQSARGKAASITARHGIPVIPTGGTPGTDDAHNRLIDHACRLGRKHTTDPSSSFLPSADIGTDEPPAKRMWACLPGVGPTMAGRLFEMFGGPVEFIDQHPAADEVNTLTDVSGVGEKTARNIYGAMFDHD